MSHSLFCLWPNSWLSQNICLYIEKERNFMFVPCFQCLFSGIISLWCCNYCSVLPPFFPAEPISNYLELCHLMSITLCASLLLYSSSLCLPPSLLSFSTYVSPNFCYYGNYQTIIHCAPCLLPHYLRVSARVYSRQGIDRSHSWVNSACAPGGSRSVLRRNPNSSCELKQVQKPSLPPHPLPSRFRAARLLRFKNHAL